MDDMEQYQRPTSVIDCDHPTIMQLADTLTQGFNNDSEKAVRLFNYVRDNCHYTMYATTGDIEAYRSSIILEKGRGWCVQKAILLCSLCRAAGIPSRLILVSIRNHKSPPEALELMGTNVFFPHMYNHIFLNGQWVKAAATFDREICERTGVPVVNFDGKADAILQERDLAGRPYIEYLEEYGTYADLPWEFIVENSYRIYGEITKRWLNPQGSSL